MADLTGGQPVARTLRGAGVRHVFTLCGGHINGMELETAVRFGLPFTCIIGNDGGWGRIRSPQVSFFGAARTVATSPPTTRDDRMVEALGGWGAFITDPREIGPALTQALASDEVWCLNVVLAPEAYRKSGQGSMAV